MKKLLAVMLIIVLLLAGCAPSGKTEETVPVSEKTEQKNIQTEEEDVSAYPAVWEYDGAGSLNDRHLFFSDLDGDGKTEEIKIIDPKTISVGGTDCNIPENADFAKVALVKLGSDAKTYVLLSYTYDEYYAATVQLEYKEGNASEIFKCDSYFYIENGKIYMTEETDMLGTHEGACEFTGAPLKPVSEFYECIEIPGIEDLFENREELLETGLLLHVKSELSAEKDGEETVIPAGSCIYLLSFDNDNLIADVQIENGEKVRLRFEYREESAGFYIGGIPQEELFDNLNFAG